MNLTAAQKTTLKTNIAANTNNVSIDYGDGRGLLTDQIKNWDPANDGQIATVIANWYNLFPGTDFFGNYSTVPVSAVRGAISWKKLTPSDTMPTLVLLDTTVWMGRAMNCQGLQFNVQMLLTASNNVNGNQVLDATQRSVWQGFKDALQTVPSGASGATQDAGWAGAGGVQQTLCRKGTNLEKLFADLTNGTGADNTHAASFQIEGAIDGPTLGDAVRVG